ncbi:MAG: hypothetical protein ACREVE_10640 [Gammaproteobacteria bacterium]
MLFAVHLIAALVKQISSLHSHRRLSVVRVQPRRPAYIKRLADLGYITAQVGRRGNMMANGGLSRACNMNTLVIKLRQNKVMQYERGNDTDHRR